MRPSTQHGRGGLGGRERDEVLLETKGSSCRKSRPVDLGGMVRDAPDEQRVDAFGRASVLEGFGMFQVGLLLGQRDVGVVDELEGVVIVLVELVGERALCENA